MKMSEGHLENAGDFQLSPGSLLGWNSGHTESPFSETIQATIRIPEEEATSHVTALDGDRYPQQSAGLNWSYPGDQHQHLTRGLGRVINNVSTNEQGPQLNYNPLDWPNSHDFRGGKSGGSTLERLVDNSYATHGNRSVDGLISLDPEEFSAQNIQTYPSAANGILGYPCGLQTYCPDLSLLISDYQEQEREPMVIAGNAYGEIEQDLAQNRLGLAGRPEAAIDGNNVSSEFWRDYQNFMRLVEQANQDLSASITSGLSQCHLTSFQAGSSPHNPLANVPISEAETPFPQSHTFTTPDLLPTSVPPLVYSENLPPNSGANNQFLRDTRSSPTGGFDTFKFPSDSDASSHRTRSFSIPDDFGPSTPHYLGYMMSHLDLRNDSCQSPLKPTSPSSSILEMDHSTLDTPKTFYSASISPPSTAGGSSPKKRSSLSARIRLPPTIKEFNYNSSTLITKKSRGRKPLTRPHAINSPPDAQLANIVSNPALNVQFFGQHWNVISDPELLSSMETEATSNVAKAFVCEVDGCRKCFRRCEHLRRHVRTIHSAEKPFTCRWPGCNKRFNRNDNLNQHFQTHTR
ncbi:hypothetical protein PtA15_8A635 [Puccinia triticina]|uniref:C2H2-type domain-containing protein n=1 Tax=Puccinia triticina TaxID=208348 RepID=A0ABY7CST9_9BASI|nr:uncharacterized protein PtA15_8A635 [Puccinia triticina]WAQ87729.1 hypothetical protein PtA15_8A635 [Puccinia triticina]